MPIKFTPFVIEKIINETHDTKTFRLKNVEGRPMFFKPGQFVNMYILKEDGSFADARSMSISSSPTITGYIDLTIKIVPDGRFTPKLLPFKLGDKFGINGPFGRSFNFSEDDLKKHFVLIAGGVGITPLMCIIRYVINKKASTKMILLYSNKTPKDIIYYEELNKLESLNGNLKVVNTVTRPHESATEWHGLTGRINEDLIRKHVHDISNTMFFLCGPDTMIKELIETLKKMGASDSQIKFEKWG